jgi:hypothetical protein
MITQLRKSIEKPYTFVLNQKYSTGHVFYFNFSTGISDFTVPVYDNSVVVYKDYPSAVRILDIYSTQQK